MYRIERRRAKERGWNDGKYLHQPVRCRLRYALCGYIPCMGQTNLQQTKRNKRSKSGILKQDFSHLSQPRSTKHRAQFNELVDWGCQLGCLLSY